MSSLDLLSVVKQRNPGETEFLQAVEEVYHSVTKVLERHPKYAKFAILEQLVEPERVISFRVPWVNDQGEVHVNR